ncbi:hypothetical protein EYF80_039898 [Liparis tanakae]|uniref:Uncharacterized protein n=1 Tax=Liparis tanakae TaxID=230148 RepID=A0A4Z2G8U4_9TELE|nr:hypothetical protein EYF80_039898 [Liparis tanakae]
MTFDEEPGEELLAFMGDAFVGDAFVGDAFIGDAFIGDAFIGDAFMGDFPTKPFSWPRGRRKRNKEELGYKEETMLLEA